MFSLLSFTTAQALVRAASGATWIGQASRWWSYFSTGCSEQQHTLHSDAFAIFNLRAICKQYGIRVNPLTYSKEAFLVSAI